jgi:hypothetical protein
MRPIAIPTQFVITTTPSPREGRPLRAGEGVASLSCLEKGLEKGLGAGP